MKYVTYWYQFFTHCEELVPIFHGVKFAKCEICGLTKLLRSLSSPQNNRVGWISRKKRFIYLLINIYLIDFICSSFFFEMPVLSPDHDHRFVGLICVQMVCNLGY